MFDAEPEGWEQKALGEIITLEYGRALPEASRLEGSVPVYGSNGPVGSHADHLIGERGIVVGRKGTAGSVHVTSGPFWPIDTTYYVRPRRDVDFDWLAAALRHADLGSLNEATGVPGLNRENAYRRPILVPPPYEQRRIAEVLRAMDEAISSGREAADAARQVSQTMRHELLHVTVEGEIVDLPADWEVRPLEALATVERGKFSVRPRNDPRYFGGDTPFVQTGDITAAGDYLTRHTQTLNELGVTVSRVFPAGAIMTTIAANIGDFTITTYPVACPDSVVGIEAREGVHPFWLYSVLSCFKVALDKAATQNAQKNINLQTLRPLLIPVPPPCAMTELAETLEAAAATARKGDEACERLSPIKTAVMDDLLSGRVRVPV